MKKYLLLLFVSFSIQKYPAFAGVSVTTIHHPKVQPISDKKTGHNLLCTKVYGSSLVNFNSTYNAQLLRLKLIKDSINNDDIVIGFNPTASVKYNGNEDSQYLPGINAPEGLSSISGDGVQLSQNYLPLPKQKPLVIKLDVEAENGGLFNLERTELDSLPPIYNIWLVDNYKKDSLDLKHNTSYYFTIDKTDTTTFGKNRFYIVVRQDTSLSVHLLGFTASKTDDGAQINWKTENEQDYTNFTIERSADNGFTFKSLTTFRSGSVGTYSYVDANLPAGTDQYRLKMEDLNGTISYSDVITLQFGSANTANNITVYPNPSGGTINIDINPGGNTASNFAASQATGLIQSNGTESYGIKIINITGSVMKTATSTQAKWQDNVGNLKPGTYIVQIVNNGNNRLVGKSIFVKL